MNPFKRKTTEKQPEATEQEKTGVVLYEPDFKEFGMSRYYAHQKYQTGIFSHIRISEEDYLSEAEYKTTVELYRKNAHPRTSFDAHKIDLRDFCLAVRSLESIVDGSKEIIDQLRENVPEEVEKYYDKYPSEKPIDEALEKNNKKGDLK